VAPGIVGVRNAKWVKTLIISDEEVNSPYQKEIYKMISEMDPDKIDYDKYEAVMGQVINSAIVYPNLDQELKITKSSPFIPIKGWAVGNQYAGHPVDKVEVSLD
jgi:hypothetical protein